MRTPLMFIHVFWSLFFMTTSLQAQYLSKRVRGNSVRFVTADHKVLVWGENAGGSMGNGTHADVYTPLDISSSGSLDGKTIIALAAGDNHCVALDDSGAVYTWGHNYYGPLGDGDFNDRLYPGPIVSNGVLSGKRIIYIAAGDHNTFAIADDYKVYSWGWNYFGMLGNGEGDQSDDHNTCVPGAVDTTGVLAGKKIVNVASGLWFVIALDSEGHVYSWGINEHGSLGNNSNDYLSNIPVAVDTTGVLKGKKIIDIAAGEAFAIVVDEEGHVYGWGENTYGQLGNGSQEDSFVPVAVDTSGVLKGKKIISIAAGDHHCLALGSDGKLYAWGLNDYGQLGNEMTLTSNTPVEVYMDGYLKDKTIVAVSCGAMHSAVLDDEGNVYTWGANDHGQLGVRGIPEYYEAILAGETLPSSGLTGFEQDFNSLTSGRDTALWTYVLGNTQGENNITGTVENGSLKFVCNPNKSFWYSILWKFNASPDLTQYLDITDHPYVSFRVKVEPGARMNDQEIDMVNIGLDFIGTEEYLSQQIPDDGEWHKLYFKFNGNNTAYKHVTGLRVHPGLNEDIQDYSPGFTGTVWIDDLHIGDKVTLPVELTEIDGFAEYFTYPVDMGFWIPNTDTHEDGTPVFFVLQQQGALKITMKQKKYDDGQMYAFAKLGYILNLTEYPKAQIKLKVDSGALMSGVPVDSIPFSMSPFSSDYSVRNGIVYPYSQQHSPQTFRVPADGVWHVYTFDWSSADTVPASDGFVYPNQYGKISYLLLESVNAPGKLYEATFWLDDVRIGKEVDHPTSFTEPQADENGYHLLQNYPNPFCHFTNIKFVLPEPSRVTLSIYDNSGKRINVLLTGYMERGPHTVRFEPHDLPAGIYFYQLKTENFTGMKRMIIIKNK